VSAVSAAAGEEPGAKLAAKVFGFRGQRGFVCACAECDLLLLREGVSRCSVPDARELETVKQKSDLSGRLRTDFDARLLVLGQETKDSVDSG